MKFPDRVNACDEELYEVISGDATCIGGLIKCIPRSTLGMIQVHHTGLPRHTLRRADVAFRQLQS